MIIVVCVLTHACNRAVYYNCEYVKKKIVEILNRNKDYVKYLCGVLILILIFRGYSTLDKLFRLKKKSFFKIEIV